MAGPPRMIRGHVPWTFPGPRPVSVRVAPSASPLANPKSPKFAVPSPASMTLSLLKSRWTTPTACRCAAASNTCSARAVASEWQGPASGESSLAKGLAVHPLHQDGWVILYEEEIINGHAVGIGCMLGGSEFPLEPLQSRVALRARSQRILSATRRSVCASWTP